MIYIRSNISLLRQQMPLNFTCSMHDHNEAKTYRCEELIHSIHSILVHLNNSLTHWMFTKHISFLPRAINRLSNNHINFQRFLVATVLKIVLFYHGFDYSPEHVSLFRFLDFCILTQHGYNADWSQHFVLVLEHLRIWRTQCIHILLKIVEQDIFEDMVRGILGVLSAMYRKHNASLQAFLSLNIF